MIKLKKSTPPEPPPPKDGPFPPSKWRIAREQLGCSKAEAKRIVYPRRGISQWYRLPHGRTHA